MLLVMDHNLNLTNMPVANFSTSVGAAEDSGLIAGLPSPDTKRWVVRHKAVVVQAVRKGWITLEDACRRYNLSSEEFIAWQRAIELYGIPGLRVTRLQIYRDTDAARAAKQISPA